MSKTETPFPAKKTDRFLDVWIELRTSAERIEGAVRLPPQARRRRLADLLAAADRDESGVLHLVNATVFDARSNAVKFHKRSLGVSRRSVVFASPLAAPNESKLPWSLPPAEILNN